LTNVDLPTPEEPSNTALDPGDSSAASSPKPCPVLPLTSTMRAVGNASANSDTARSASSAATTSALLTKTSAGMRLFSAVIR
jgi:hypothetical protein